MEGSGAERDLMKVRFPPIGKSTLSLQVEQIHYLWSQACLLRLAPIDLQPFLTANKKI